MPAGLKAAGFVQEAARPATGGIARRLGRRLAAYFRRRTTALQGGSLRRPTIRHALPAATASRPAKTKAAAKAKSVKGRTVCVAGVSGRPSTSFAGRARGGDTPGRRHTTPTRQNVT